MKTKAKTKPQSKQAEIGRIPISDNSDLVATLVDNEKLDLRIFIKNETYEGPTKRGLRWYLFDGNWEAFKELIERDALRRYVKIFEQSPAEELTCGNLALRSQQY